MVAACETTTVQPNYPAITFGHLAPVNLDVAAVEYVDQYIPPQEAPNVEHLFPVLPSAVAGRWAQDRLLATGVTRRARVVLVTASVTETPLATTKGLTGTFTIDQVARYDAKAEMRVEIVTDTGVVEGTANAIATRSRTVPEDITLNQRDQLWFEMTEALMRDLDGQLVKNIKLHLVRWVR
jgi:hypothetical protein